MKFQPFYTIKSKGVSECDTRINCCIQSSLMCWQDLVQSLLRPTSAKVPGLIVHCSLPTHLITQTALQAVNSENPSSCSSFDIWDLTRATLGDNKWCLESFNKTILTVCPHNTEGGISVWKIALIIISVIPQFLLLFLVAN